MKKSDKELTEAELKDLKEKANVILAFCRQQLLTKHPFIGNVGMNLNLIPTRDLRNPTACTDGSTIFFDIAFLADLNQEEREFVLGHEIWHNVMMHMLRRESREMTKFNLATDMEVNQLLESDGFCAPNDLVWPNGNGRHKSQFNFPSGLSAEEYYDLIVKEAQNQQQNGQGQSGEGSGEQQQGGRGQAGKGGGKKLSGQFDKHTDPSDKEENTEDLEGATDKYGKRGIDPDFKVNSGITDQEKRQLAEKMRESVVSAAQQTERSRGELPGFIKKIVDGLLEPKIPWKEVLAAFMTSTVVNKTNWNRPNRRFAYSGTYLPCHDGESMKIAIGVDTSGSCMQDFPKFITEIAAIAKTFGAYELHTIQCDTEVKDYTVYDECNPLDEEAAKKIEFKGCGGTILKPVFDYIELNDIDVDAVVFFTDGCCEEFKAEEAPQIPVIWCITGSKDVTEFKNLGFGEKLSIE